MAQNFATKTLRLSNQSITASGNSLFINTLPINESFLSVKSFGTSGNGFNNDTFAIQNAINAYQNNSGQFSYLYFPPGFYLTTGILNATGNNLYFQGDGQAYLISSGENDCQKIYFTSGSGCTWDGINLRGGRVTGTGIFASSSGMITASGTNYLTIQNCNLRDTVGNAIVFNSYNWSPKIINNIFDNYQIGIYSQTSNTFSNINGTGCINKAKILHNEFLTSWATSTPNFAGGIKLQALLNGTGYSVGNIISNNQFFNTAQMGIELWGNISNSVVSNNTIDGSVFGISIAHDSRDITVANNTTKNFSFIGIEIADCLNVTVLGNTIDGATGNMSGQNSNAQYGIFANGVNFNPNYTTIQGNTVRNCGNQIICYSHNYANINGNILTYSGQSRSATLFANQNASNVIFSNNTLNNITSGVYFIYLEGGNGGSTGVTISNNDINGTVSDWGIFYENFNSSTSNNSDILIENNRTYGVKSCGFGMVDVTDFPPTNTIHRNNVGQTGGLGYSIPDYTFPTNVAPFATANIQAGISYYGTINYTIPSGGITGNGIWLCPWSGGGGLINNLRTNIFSSTSLGDNGTNMEIVASMTPNFGGGIQDSLMINPEGLYDNTLIKTIRTNGVYGAVGNCQLWVLVGPISSGVSGQQINFYNSSQNLISNVISTYTEPVWSPNSIEASTRNYQNLYLSRGITFNNDSQIFSPNSGALTLQSSGLNFVNIPTANSANLGGVSIPATAAGFMLVNITGGYLKIPYYNV